MRGNLEKHPLMEGKMIKATLDYLGMHDGMGNPHNKGSYVAIRLTEHGDQDDEPQSLIFLVPEHQLPDTSQAAVAAALERAKDAVDAIDDHNSGPIASALLDARNAIRALITDDQQAALDAVRAEERERICDWLRKNLSDGHTIAAAIREGVDDA